ncbi:MAG: hypothetical protein ACOYI6_07655 [Christensenellales bacterium]|jgi:hypothetical protein|nr:hypothetical protein [Clostridiales bacterium]
MDRDAAQGNRFRFYLTMAAIVLVAVLILYVLGVFGGGPRRLNVTKLRCVTTQQVTPFGDKVLYYDGTNLYCLNANGTEQWKYALGPGARFTASDSVVTAWAGSHLHILDRSGRASFNDRLPDPIQFAKAGRQYVAAVVGEGVSPTLLVKDVNGLAVDSESVAYGDKMILDMDFFENGNYLWTTSLDVYGISPVIVMNIYRVGAMNTGEVDLGEEITYKVVYAGDKLHVVNTKELNLYDYRGTRDPFSKQLVYGWKLIDSNTAGNNAVLLFAPEMQTANEQQITELRVLTSNKRDSRYTLPNSCVGAGLKGNTIFAISADTLYQAELNAQRFSAIKLPVKTAITGYIGKLSNGSSLVSSGLDVYLISLP